MRYSVFFGILLFTSHFGRSQDTLNLSLKQADSIFLEKNYYLLAATMNIEAQKASIIQAKLYPNPVFTAEMNAYDTQNSRTFHIDNTGEKAFQLEQLILLGGKRKSEIEMAKTNEGISELEFQKLMLELKFRLHSNLFAAGEELFLLEKYNAQLSLLDTLLNIYQTQADKGNIPMKEVVRLQGAYLKLNNDRAQLFKEYFATQSELQTLLQTSAIVALQFTEDNIKNYIKPNSLAELQSVALTNRPELLIIRQNQVLAEQYYQYQKKNAIPDVNLFTSYDQRGGAFINQVNAGISFQLPVWNRNQGNIRASQYKIKEAEYNSKAMENEILSELQSNYAFYIQTVSEYKKSTSLYNSNFETIQNGMVENFQKRNVSMIEFMDFFESYNSVLTELTRIRTQLVISGEQLNLLTGKIIY